MSESKKRKPRKTTSNTTSLSSNSLQKNPVNEKQLDELEAIREQVFLSINNVELQKSLDMWMKRNIEESKIQSRDLSILKGLITEYLGSYILFGYDIKGDRIIIQNCENAKDRDALMEFLKIIFFKQQNENFLDQDDEY